ncbi:MAG: LytTR family DNA-binding domain-containing protein [Lachnospiraceae bacterium]|nr:LytTR family DNA-binding domain-containing protein [Lachnospiraceae bacterium]MDE6698936.1 LytTR family DNA-binding domain-containing protein [Lachnospiraceae bacterium]
MINILILEDQKESREALQKIIASYGRANEVDIDAAGSLKEAEVFLNNNKTYNGFFIDINLNPEDNEDESGIEFAKLLRKNRKYEFTPVIMVTSIASLEMTSFREIHCYQYIVKPYDRKTVEDVISKIVMNGKVAEEKYIIVKKDGINYKIKCDAIQYVQAITRGVQIKLSKENVKVPYLTIKEFMTKVDKEDFIQCHRMYVVNKNHIESVDVVNRMISLEDGNVVEIGVTYKDKIKAFIEKN